MIVNIFEQILGLFAVTFLGYLIVNLFLFHAHIMEKLSLGFLVGLGIFTFGLFLTNWAFDIPFQIYPVVAILSWMILFSVFLNFLFKRNISFKLITSFKGLFVWYKTLSIAEKAIFCLTGFILFSVLVSDLFWPIWMWDAIALYDYRAKNMVLLGKIVGSFSVSSDTYPLLTSLSHGVIYLFGGTNPQYLYFLFLLSLSVIFYFFLRRFLSRKYCLVSLLFLISIPLLIQQAQVTLADLPQSAYLVPAFLYLILGLIGGKKSQILLSGMLFSLGAWVRNEPFWMVGFVVLFVFSFKRKWFIIDGLYCVFANIVSHFWVNFINSHSLASSTSEVVKPNLFTDQLHTLLSLHYWITVILFVFNNILLLTLPLYIAMILLLILKRKVLNKTAIILTCLICGIILLFTAGSAFYILTTDYWPALYSSLQRIIIFLDVLVVADISLLFFPGVSNFGV